ncbi:hypothetical protein PENTCL1PPCAC_6453 [Pristionchus entomophagus]|uniref:RNA helicase n=1 Tax=Pristionchus entomophagus TaxID=358040 RepID=A0AAV5SQ75_9BILA|nr:hypothetical protein PENTCL1PPCAC_6453 [Pristionchus entomophagus]
MGDSWGAAFIEQERKERGAVQNLAAQTTTLNLTPSTPFVNNNAFGAAGARTTQSPVITYGGPKMEPSSPSTPSRKTPEPVVDKPMSAEEISLLNKFLHKTVNLMKNDSLDISEKQLDPNSPLYSVHSFKDMRLREPLLKACNALGFHQPSRIQEFALPLLLMEPPTNLIAQSQSGTGKTAAFLLSMLSRVVVEDKFPQCICLAPTYELAMQIGEVVTKLTQFMPEVTVHYAVKGVKVTRGEQLTDHFVIGTPGKMLDYVTKLKMFDASKVICLVLDEADVMMSQQGHQDLSIRIYSEIERASPSVQTLLFSATYDQTVMEFANKIVKNAVSVTLNKKEQSLPNIKQYYVECLNREAKYEAVVNLYSGLTIASAIIFCHTRQSASWLALRMREKGHEVGVLHGDLSVEERAKSIQQFKEGHYKVLVTTNAVPAGIDVSQVTVVINYDPPVHFNNQLQPDCETYLHRIGRTGRFGKAGIAINFVDSRDSLNIVKKIEAHFETKITKLDPSDIEELTKLESPSTRSLWMEEDGCSPLHS